MVKDEKRNNKPISNRLTPQDDPLTIATVELFVSDSKIQKEIEHATDNYASDGGRKGPGAVINYDAQG
jgi:hypothetical protein